MSIYNFTSYKQFFDSWLASQPKKGRGLISQLADHMRISSTMLSHVFKGDKHLSLEAASDLTDFIGLNPEETDYFFLLVEYERAGSFSLQNKLLRKIKAEQQKAAQLSTRMKVDAELPETVKTVFYSSWIYTGIRNMVACPEYKNVDQIAHYLNLPRPMVQRVIDFLVQNQLCILKNGQLETGPKRTHVGADSPLVAMHHQNWRIHGFEKMLHPKDQNLFFTGPMSLSHETAEKIRQELPSFIEKIGKWVHPSPSEVVRCLNIDWFEY